MRMSHEVNSPSVHETEGQKLIFDPGSLWDAGGVEWSADSRYLSMGMRQYDNGTNVYELKLDLEARTGTLTYNNQTAHEAGLADLQSWMQRVVNPAKGLKHP